MDANLMDSEVDDSTGVDYEDDDIMYWEDTDHEPTVTRHQKYFKELAATMKIRPWCGVVAKLSDSGELQKFQLELDYDQEVRSGPHLSFGTQREMQDLGNAGLNIADIYRYPNDDQFKAPMEALEKCINAWQHGRAERTSDSSKLLAMGGILILKLCEIQQEIATTGALWRRAVDLFYFSRSIDKLLARIYTKQDRITKVALNLMRVHRRPPQRTHPDYEFLHAMSLITQGKARLDDIITCMYLEIPSNERGFQARSWLDIPTSILDLDLQPDAADGSEDGDNSNRKESDANGEASDDAGSLYETQARYWEESADASDGVLGNTSKASPSAAEICQSSFLWSWGSEKCSGTLNLDSQMLKQLNGRDIAAHDSRLDHHLNRHAKSSDEVRDHIELLLYGRGGLWARRLVCWVATELQSQTTQPRDIDFILAKCDEMLTTKTTDDSRPDLARTVRDIKAVFNHRLVKAMGARFLSCELAKFFSEAARLSDHRIGLGLRWLPDGTPDLRSLF